VAEKKIRRLMPDFFLFGLPTFCHYPFNGHEKHFQDNQAVKLSDEIFYD